VAVTVAVVSTAAAVEVEVSEVITAAAAAAAAAAASAVEALEVIIVVQCTVLDRQGWAIMVEHTEDSARQQRQDSATIPVLDMAVLVSVGEQAAFAIALVSAGDSTCHSSGSTSTRWLF